MKKIVASPGRKRGNKPPGRLTKGHNTPGPGRRPGSKNALTTWREALDQAYSAKEQRDIQARVLKQLVKAADEGKDWAVREWFDRSMGRPQQSLEVSGQLDFGVLLGELSGAGQ